MKQALWFLNNNSLRLIFKSYCNKMPRRNRNFRNKNKSQENGSQNVDQRKPYQDIVRENEAFVKYYQNQNVCNADEWDNFIKALKSDLPTTFRITANRDESQAMLRLVESEFLHDILQHNPEETVKELKDDQKNESKLFPLSWYPDRMAWQLNLSRKDIRRDERYYKLHNFLISETENGTISRQETVSMIPPLVLNVQSHHKVLDMCAAPGSKTAQLIELLHKTDTEPTGFVVANDVDNKRCYMLVHQAKRLNSPCIVIMNHDATILPNLLDSKNNPIKYDRILCDVPCSGDGTMRKNPDIWMKWSPGNGLNQHGIQIRIARRAAELLAVGGRLVYSTCSINPVENEAVIHRLLNETEGALKLVDVAKELPGLKYVPGVETWKIGTKSLDFYEKWEDVDKKWHTTVKPQMFPPAAEDREKYGLNKCIRILPHLQDTGAFFVAVLEKVSALSEKETKQQDQVKKEQSEAKSSDSDSDKEPPNKKRRGYREDPFVFFNADEAIWPSIKEFYEISNSFDSTCLLTRCNIGKKKNIYYTSPVIKDLILRNSESIKFINSGVKAFVRSDNRHMKCAFRLANEGLDSVLSFIGPGRKIKASKNDIIALLSTTDSVPFEKLEDDLRTSSLKLSPGSCILMFEEEKLKLNLVGWRGVTSLRCYISQHHTVHLLRLLGGDVSKFEVNKFKKDQEEQEKVD